MTDLAYMIGNPEPLKFSPDVRNNVPFSRLEENLRREGYNLPSPIKHILLDVKIPLVEFFQLFKKVFPPFQVEDPDFFQGINSTDSRYRTIVVSDQLTMWGMLGYSVRADRKKELSKSIKAYIARGKYEDPLPVRESYFNPPYFALTSLESVAEVKEAFESFGIEVQLVNKLDRVSHRKNRT